jgi:outer membrane protein TolC
VRDSLKISRDYQAQLHEAVQAGIAFKGDELRIQVQTELYQISLRQSVEQERLNAARLAQHLHLDPVIVLTPADTGLLPLSIIGTNAALDLLVHQALRSRPEISQRQAVAAAADEERKGSVYGPLIPALGAQVFAGGLGGGPRGASDTFGSSEDYAIGLSWRIGPGGLFDPGRRRAAQARLDIATLNKTKTADEISRQVVESFTRAESLADQLNTAKINLVTASEVLRLSAARKEFGVAAVLEHIQAEQDLTRARSEFLRVVAEHNKAQYALYTAVGNVPTP